MKLIKKLAAVLLLTFGVPLSIWAICEIANPNTDAQDRSEALAALTILTLPSAAAGGWLAWGLRRQNQKEIGDRLQSTFYKLIQEGNGHINVLRFSMETKLTASVAKQYLDEKAKEFNADFIVGNDSSISYYFALGDFTNKNLTSAQPTTTSLEQFDAIVSDKHISNVNPISTGLGQFDVVVTAYPAEKKIAVLRVVRQLTGWGLRKAKNFVESLPNTLKQGVSESVAKSYQQQLESAGAKVKLVSESLDTISLRYAGERQFAIVVTECPANKLIPVIKVVRNITDCGLKEAKDFVESLPQTLKQGLSESVAKSYQQQLESAGAKVKIIYHE